MLIRDSAKATITVINLLPAEENRMHLFKTILHDCSWMQGDRAISRRTGMAVPAEITLLIPFDSEYVSVKSGEVFGGSGWTLNIGPEFLGSYILKRDMTGEYPHPGLIEKEDMINFAESNAAFRPREIVEHFVGTRSMWYIEVKC